MKTAYKILSEKYEQVQHSIANEAEEQKHDECWVRGKKVDIDSIELDEGKGNEAKAVKASYADGTPLTPEELEELNNPGTSTGVSNVKQQPDLVNGAPTAVIGEEDEKEISPEAIEKGTKHEMEHTKDPLVAKKIAMDHLREDPHYYEKLAKAGLEENVVGELTDEELHNIVVKIEKMYSNLHPVDWYNICQILLDRADVSDSIQISKGPSKDREDFGADMGV